MLPRPRTAPSPQRGAAPQPVDSRGVRSRRPKKARAAPAGHARPALRAETAGSGPNRAGEGRKRGSLPTTGSRQAPGEDALLRMQAVLRLVEHHRLRSIDYFGGHFLAAMGRQAMHEDGVRLGLFHQPLIDLIAAQQIVSARRAGAVRILIAHRYPGIGDDAVGATYDGLGVMPDGDAAFRLLGPGQHIGR